MKKRLVSFFAAALTAVSITPCVAQERTLKISYAALATATVADASTSVGKYETNGLLASGDGRFEAKGAAIKCGIMAGLMEMEHALTKNHPEIKKPLAVANFFMAGLLTGVAIHNSKIKPAILFWVALSAAAIAG